MNDLYTDIGWFSLNKHGEELCGDRVELSEAEDGSRVAVLADGMGSGVKANILATLTSRLFSKLVAAGLPLDECVRTMATTLPAAKDGVIYSTFSVVHVTDSERADIIECGNPPAIFIHDGESLDYERCETEIDGKLISTASVELSPGDLLVTMSDGVIGAGTGLTMNMRWMRSDVADFLSAVYHPDYTAKDICTLLLDECRGLYAGEPGDDTTVCVTRICGREQVNLVFGPPKRKADDERMMELFFSKEGRHIVCGGTTAKIAARFLKKPVVPVNEAPDPSIPPISRIDGVDLVTEGAVTLARVLENAANYASDNSNYFKWGNRRDGASMVSRLLFEKATDIDLFIGRAENKEQRDERDAYAEKLRVAELLADRLRSMGKNIKVSYF